MDAMELGGVRPGQRISGVARVVGVREEELDDEPIRIVELRNDTGSMQALLRVSQEPRAPLKAGDLVEAHGTAEAMWRGGPMVLHLESVRRTRSPEPSTDAPEDAPACPEEFPDGILLELPRPIAAYLLWLTSRDLERWTDRRKTQLSRDEVRALALFLHDQLPLGMRTELPSPRVAAPTNRKRQAA